MILSLGWLSGRVSHHFYLEQNFCDRLMNATRWRRHSLDFPPYPPGHPVTVSVTVQVPKGSRLGGNTGEHNEQRQATNPLMGLWLPLYGVSYDGLGF